MNMFGLGVVLNVTDNMSTGFVNVMNTFNQFENQMNSLVTATANGMSQFEAELNKSQYLSFLGMGVQQLGNQIADVGTSMIKPFVNFGSQVLQTGAQFENYRLTLKALYGDVEKATSITNQAMDLAAKTPFQISDVMDSVVGFKAIGVEALDTMEHLTGESRTLLEYIGDLASLRPDIGLDGMLMGIRNLLGGDGGRSLRSRLDMDFEQMLGFEWADTTEGMIEQIVYASQQIANGLMQEMEGSWQHMTSNIEDQWDKVKLSVSDAGAFDSVKNTLKYFYDVVDSIDDEKMARIGENIAGAFNMIWQPIDFVARKLSDIFNWVVNLIAESPTLTKFVTGFTAVAGAVLVAVGAMTVLGGSVLLAVAGFKGLQLMFTKLPTFIMGLAPKLLSLATVLGKYALIGGALYLAWKNDFMGVRTLLQNFMNNVSTAFKESARISQLGVDDMMSALKQLDTTTFGGWLTYRLTQIRVFWMALVDAWNDNTLSDENFQKVQALGLLPLLETILDLKMKAEAFFEGFKIGMKKVSDVVVPILSTLCEWVGKIWDFLFPINDEVDEFNNSGKNLDIQPWADLGEVVSYVVSGIAGLFVVSKVIGFFTMVGKAIGTVISFVGKIPNVFKGVMSFLGRQVLKPILAGIGGVVTAILGAFGIVISAPAWVVGAVTLAIIGAIALLIKYKDEAIEIAGKILGGIASVITGVVTGTLVAILSVGVALSTFFMMLGGVVGTVCGVIAGVIITLALGVEAIIKASLEIVKALIETAIQSIIGTISVIIGVVATIMQTLGGIIDTALTIIKGLFDTVIAVIKAVWTGDFTTLGETIKSIWSGVGDRIKEIWNNVCDRVSEIWNGVKDRLSQSFDNIKEAWGIAMENIQTIADRCVDTVKDVWNGIGSFFSNMWQGIMDSASSMFNWLADKFSWVTNSINAVKGFFNWGGNNIKLEADLPKPKVGLATGGFVKDEGVAMLHPNEVVINDELTRKLRSFLNDEETVGREKEADSKLASVDQFNQVARQLVTNNSTNQQVSNDYSVTFDKGSIQITVEDGSDSNIDAIAEKIMLKIKRMQQLEKTRNYQPY